MNYNLKYYINISCVVFFKIKPKWNFFVLYEWDNGSSMISHRFGIHHYKISSILFIIFFSSKNIIHPWHVANYFSMSPNILSHVSNNILLMSVGYPWKDSLGLTCSHSCVHRSCSQDNIPRNLGDMFLVWKVMWPLATMPFHVTKVQATHACRNAWSCWWRWWQWQSTSYKNSQVPTSINIVVCKWKPLHVTSQYCICNILPFFFLYDFWYFLCWTWCSPRFRSIINNIPKSPSPFPYLLPRVEKEAMQSIELNFQMIGQSIPCFLKNKSSFCMLQRFFRCRSFLIMW
jgi:hypothetical protein